MADTHSAEKKRAFDTYETTVSKIEELTPRVKGIRFDLPAGKTMEFQAGQFIQIFIPTPEKVRRTSYSIASAPHHSTFFELCVTLVDGGISSSHLHKLKSGDRIQAMGPLGRFTMVTPDRRDVVFIATGSGVAPFRSMIQDLYEKKSDRDVYLVFGNRFENDIIYRKEWDELAARWPRFKRLFTLSRPDASWNGRKGYVQEAVADFVPDLVKKDFYICGLVKMIDAVTEKLLSLGVPKEQIHFERYD